MVREMPPEALALFAWHVDISYGYARKAWEFLWRGEQDRAEEAMDGAAVHAGRARALLLAYGVKPSGEATGEDTESRITQAIPDTPEARQLLSLLGQAQILAEQVDVQAGHTFSDPIAQPRVVRPGTSLAEDITVLILRLQREIEK